MKKSYEKITNEISIPDLHRLTGIPNAELRRLAGLDCYKIKGKEDVYKGVVQGYGKPIKGKKVGYIKINDIEKIIAFSIYKNHTKTGKTLELIDEFNNLYRDLGAEKTIDKLIENLKLKKAYITSLGMALKDYNEKRITSSMLDRKIECSEYKKYCKIEDRSWTVNPILFPICLTYSEIKDTFGEKLARISCSSDIVAFTPKEFEDLNTLLIKKNNMDQYSEVLADKIYEGILQNGYEGRNSYGKGMDFLTENGGLNVTSNEEWITYFMFDEELDDTGSDLFKKVEEALEELTGETVWIKIC